MSKDDSMRRRINLQRGRYYPIAKGSTEKSQSVEVREAKSGMGVWHVLKCGVKVYVLFKNNLPIMWIPLQVEVNNETNEV